MRRWWRFWEQPTREWLTPEAIQTLMPHNSRSVIVHFGENAHHERFYWQLRRQTKVKDLAIRALHLSDREAQLPLTARSVQDFCAAIDSEKLMPLYLLQVPADLIDAGVMRQLSDDHQTASHLVNLVMPAQVMYDFLANDASADAQVPVRVGELLDGWPMKHSRTLEAFLQADEDGALQRPVPLPAQPAVTIADWQQADTAITELFDVPLRQVVTTQKAATFVFTDVG